MSYRSDLQEGNLVAGRYAITAIGDDCPGIVAAFTAALMPLEANIEDTAMTLLGGQFAMVLVVRVPGGDQTVLEHTLTEVRDRLRLTVTVREVVGEVDADDGRAFTLTVYGADHPGIVHRVAQTLAELDVNIVDLATRVLSRESEHPLYAMLLDLRVPESVAEQTLGRRLDDVAKEIGVDCTLRVADADIL